MSLSYSSLFIYLFVCLFVFHPTNSESGSCVFLCFSQEATLQYPLDYLLHLRVCVCVCLSVPLFFLAPALPSVLMLRFYALFGLSVVAHRAQPSSDTHTHTHTHTHIHTL